MNVKLSDYGFCNFISGHHATIFYDEVSSIFLFYFMEDNFFNISLNVVS